MALARVEGPEPAVPGLGSGLASTASPMSLHRRSSHTPTSPIIALQKFFLETFPWGRSGHDRTSFRLPPGRTHHGNPTIPEESHPALMASQNLLLHGQQLGVHALLLPLHQLHISQQLGDAVLANLYVLAPQGGHLRPLGSSH